MSNFRKIRILVKLFENLDFGEGFRNAFILVKIIEKSRLKSTFFKYLKFCLILVKIFKNIQYRTILENLYFWQNFRKSQFW